MIVVKSPLDELKALRELKDLKDKDRERNHGKTFMRNVT